MSLGAEFDDGAVAHQGRSLIERYVSGEVTVWVKLVPRRVICETCEYLVVFESIAFDGGDSEDELLMLVDNVEVMRSPERIMVPCIRSLVRLYLINQGQSGHGYAATDVLSSFHVLLSLDSVRLTFEEVGSELFEDFGMELGPAYVAEHTIQGRLLYRSHDQDDDAKGEPTQETPEGRDDPRTGLRWRGDAEGG